MTEIIGFAVLGIIGGLLSGLLGIGGAIIIIPSLVFFYGFEQKAAQGTTLLMMIPPIGLLAALEYIKAGDFNLKAAIVLALFFLVGGLFGGKIAVRIDPGILQKIFAVFLVIIAVRLFFK